jgi:hypothetical protein
MGVQLLGLVGGEGDEMMEPKELLRLMRGVLREAPLWPAVIRPRGDKPRVAFLPAKGRQMSSLLRIYLVAESMTHLGWEKLVVPPTLTLRQRRRLLARFAPDVIVMQGSRHALNRPALYPDYRIAFDMDDADFHLPHLTAHVREAMREVDLVLAGSRYVADWCREAGADARIVWTGTPPSKATRTPHRDRAPIVAWAQSAPADYIAERAFVLDVMRRVAGRRPGVRLRLFGRRSSDDPSLLEPFRAAGIKTEWLPMMSYNRFLRALDEVAVGLSPICPETPFSRGKSFGKVLAYLDRGVPVIASDEADHGLFFTPKTAIMSNDPAVWATAIDHLLGQPESRQALADAAFGDFRRRLSTEAAAREVDAALRQLVGVPAPIVGHSRLDAA